jgi:glycosyltransferase 2 family protein
MRRALSVLFKLTISGLLLYLALNWVNIGTVASRLSQIDLRWVAFGLLLLLMQTLLLSMRWQEIISQCGADLPLGQIFRICMAALFFNQTLPSSVGGDAMRIWMAGKQTNWRIATYSVLIDRVVGAVSLAIVVTACLPWTLSLVRNPVGRSALLLIGLGCLAAGIFFVSLAWQRLHILQRWAPTRHLAATATVALGILRSPSAFARIFCLSFVIHLLTVVLAWCAARSVGANLSFAYALFLVLPVILIAIVPISIAGWGVREGAMVSAFGYAGLPPSDGLIVSLLFGASYLVVGGIGGLVWVLTTRQTGGSTFAGTLPHE